MKNGHYEYTENRPTKSYWGLGDLVKDAEGSTGPNVSTEEWREFKNELRSRAAILESSASADHS